MLLVRWSALVVLASVPSVLWMIRGPELLTDDFGHLMTYRENGLWAGAVDRSFESTGRPLVGFYYLLTYGLIGDNPTLHAAVLALLNIALVVAIWRVGMKVIDPRVAYATALLMAVVPNRGSTRLWFATGNYVLALTLVVVGFGLVAIWRRPASAAGVLLVAVLLFEGVAGLIAALLGLWMLGDRARVRSCLVAGAPAGVAAGAMYLISPKREGGPSPGDNASTLGEGLFGVGLWGGGTPGVIGAAIVVALAMFGVVRLLPSFRAQDEIVRLLQAGFVIVGVASAPFIVGGSPFAANGVFDRTNLVPTLGVCVALAAVYVRFANRVPIAALASGAVVVVYMTSLSVNDVDAYRVAAGEGQTILDRLEEDVRRTHTTIIVGPRPTESAGVAPFIYPGDLELAVRLRAHVNQRALMPWNAESCRATAAAQGGDIVGYNWRERWTTPSVDQICAAFQ